VDPVPDPLVRKSGRAGNRTRDSGTLATDAVQNQHFVRPSPFWTRKHRNESTRTELDLYALSCMSAELGSSPQEKTSYVMGGGGGGGCTLQACRMDLRNACEIFIAKPEMQRPVESSRRR
jgi:hypothetical protein